MKRKINAEPSSASDIGTGRLFQIEHILLKWIEIIIAIVCFIVLIYLLLGCPSPRPLVWRYEMLVSTEIAVLLVAIAFYEKGMYRFSSKLLILAGIIGPWWSALIDETVIRGNLFPLVYLTIPILFSSFFSSVRTTVVIGIVQSIGLAVFIYLGNYDPTLGSASVYFFVIFIFAISLIINIQNRNHRWTISRQVEQLKNFANLDPLTGLHNRRFPFEYLQNEFKRLKIQGGVLSIVIFDIDNFKFYNDTFGHHCGDEILVSIAKLINGNFRQSDISCRYGGDEFFIAMGDTKPEEARNKIESLQKLIMEERCESFCTAETPVTISVGIAAFPYNGETVEEVLKAADRGLYKAKEKGKNCVVVME